MHLFTILLYRICQKRPETLYCHGLKRKTEMHIGFLALLSDFFLVTRLIAEKLFKRKKKKFTNAEKVTKSY